MFRSLQKLHEKPVEVRRRVGLTIASVITFVIFMMWLVTFNVDTSLNGSSADVIQKNIITPFETIKRGFDRTIGTAKEQFSTLEIDLF